MVKNYEIIDTGRLRAAAKEGHFGKELDEAELLRLLETCGCIRSDLHDKLNRVLLESSAGSDRKAILDQYTDRYRVALENA